MQNIKKKIILILIVALILFIPIKTKATSNGTQETLQSEAQGVAEAYYTAKGLTGTDKSEAQNEVEKASKRFFTTITIVGFSGVIIVLCLIYRRQRGVRL